MLHFEYKEYNINIISLNSLINETVELDILRYCLNYNLTFNIQNRDIRKLVTHFVVNSIITTCKQFTNTQNILNFNNLQLRHIDSSCTDVFVELVFKLLKKFKLCYIQLDESIDKFTIDQIYFVRSLIEKCHIKTKRLDTIKNYLETHGFNHLHSMVVNNIDTQLLLCK